MNEETAMNATKATHTVEAYVDFIRRYPDSPLADKAVTGIYEILSKQFPRHQFTANIRWDALKPHLVAALREGRPLVMAFAPKDVERHDVASWKTHLVELAGVAVTFHELVPSISTPGNGTWRAGGGSVDLNVELKPFGQVEHEWSCWTGPWRGGSAVLSFFGTFGEKDRFYKVHSNVHFPQPRRSPVRF